MRRVGCEIGGRGSAIGPAPYADGLGDSAAGIGELSGQTFQSVDQLATFNARQSATRGRFIRDDGFARARGERADSTDLLASDDQASRALENAVSLQEKLLTSEVELHRLRGQSTNLLREQTREMQKALALDDNETILRKLALKQRESNGKEIGSGEFFALSSQGRRDLQGSSKRFNPTLVENRRQISDLERVAGNKDLLSARLAGLSGVIGSLSAQLAATQQATVVNGALPRQTTLPQAAVIAANSLGAMSKSVAKATVNFDALNNRLGSLLGRLGTQIVAPSALPPKDAGIPANP